MSGDGKDLKTEGLALIAKGLNDALGELKELGIVYEADAGRGFDRVGLTGLQLGHDGLTGEFKSFCERWEWGVRALVAEGSGFAVRTGLAAGTYDDTENYVVGTFKDVANAAIGNPDASEEDVEKMGWGDIFTSSPYGGNVDYSEKSFDEAWANSRQGWDDDARDFMDSPAAKAMGIRPGGMSDAEYHRMLDAAFGPSAEERARTGGQRGGEG
ncbi:hypothetical protein Shyhy01_76090 [Streptomyces hygroscopicus subsp. hygroscopicus]|nr:hypothetical protein [Streptomyces hygroscopicus]GLX54660.1 hypothetical protein Shyhy01_76090 [Streptomyces hygroscopicus subsp. hygroscopicus]